MKIGILTTYYASNYGAALQSYAFKKTLEDMGHEVEMIPYKQKYIYDHYNPLSQNKLIRKNLYKVIKEILLFRYTLPRERKFQEFVSKYITNGRKKLVDVVPEDKDIYFVGSDQLWRTFGKEEQFDPVYCGWFKAKAGAKKIAYAVSGEHLELNNKNRKYLAESFDNFDMISVREKQRADDFKSFYSKKEIEVIADPTILANPAIFEKIDYINPLVGQKYVLFYSIRRKSISYLDQVLDYTKTKEAKLLILSEGYVSELNLYRNEHKEVVYLPCAGEEEFIGAMKYALAVFTPSFHGNVFAALYHQNLHCLLLDDGHDTRPLEFLESIGIRNRFLHINDSIVDTPIDWNLVEHNLAKMRSTAIDYINRVLKL